MTKYVKPEVLVVDFSYENIATGGYTGNSQGTGGFGGDDEGEG